MNIESQISLKKQSKPINITQKQSWLKLNNQIISNNEDVNKTIKLETQAALKGDDALMGVMVQNMKSFQDSSQLYSQIKKKISRPQSPANGGVKVKLTFPKLGGSPGGADHAAKYSKFKRMVADQGKNERVSYIDLRQMVLKKSASQRISPMNSALKATKRRDVAENHFKRFTIDLQEQQEQLQTDLVNITTTKQMSKINCNLDQPPSDFLKKSENKNQGQSQQMQDSTQQNSQFLASEEPSIDFLGGLVHHSASQQVVLSKPSASIELNCKHYRIGGSEVGMIYERPLAQKYREIMEDAERTSGTIKVESILKNERHRKFDKRRQTIVDQTQSIIDSLRSDDESRQTNSVQKQLPQNNKIPIKIKSNVVKELLNQEQSTRQEQGEGRIKVSKSQTHLPKNVLNIIDKQLIEPEIKAYPEERVQKQIPTKLPHIPLKYLISTDPLDRQTETQIDIKQRCKSQIGLTMLKENLTSPRPSNAYRWPNLDDKLINHKFNPKTLEIIRSIKFEDDNFSEEVQEIIDKIKKTRTSESQELIQQKIYQDKIDRVQKEKMEMKLENQFVVDQYASYLAMRSKMHEPEFLRKRYTGCSPSQKIMQRKDDFGNFEGPDTLLPKQFIPGAIKPEAGGSLRLRLVGKMALPQRLMRAAASTASTAGELTYSKASLSKSLVGPKAPLTTRNTFSSKTKSMNLALPSQSFDAYIKSEGFAYVAMTSQLQSKLESKLIYKSSQIQSARWKYRDDPRHIYFKQCDQDQESSLPLLNHVHDKTLSLSSYALSLGHCKALAKSFEFFSGHITRLILDNCSVDDTAFSFILNGINKLKNFKKIVYRKNVFLNESLTQIKQILQKKIPNHLEELRIENCMVEAQVIRKLLELMNQQSQIQKFGLVNAKINSNIMDKQVCQLLESSKFLQELDISDNKLILGGLVRFLEILSENRKITYLNLSWNSLHAHQGIESDDKSTPKEQLITRSSTIVQSIVASTFRKVQDQKVMSTQITEKKNVRDDGGFSEEMNDINDISMNAIQNIFTFVRKNICLIHLDLSNTGLVEKQLWLFGSTLRRSYQLRGLHLSGNPGITSQLKGYLFKRARCIKPGPKNVIDLKFLPSKNKTNERQTEATYLERLHLTVTNYHKKVEGVSTPLNNKEVKNLIFTRQLGHKKDIPGSGQWKMIDNHQHDCWICDRECYTIIFWSPDIGFQKQTQVSKEDQQFISSGIKRINKNNKEEALFGNQKNPNIYGTFTNWQPRQMYEIGEFCSQIDPNRNDLRSEDALNGAWKETIWKNLQYKKPQLINADLAKVTEKSPLYVFATFMKSGKQYYGIETQEQSGENRMYIQSCISKFRTEDIPPVKKEFKTIDRGVRRFRKETSVFRKWIQDDLTTLKNCITQDFKRWKITRFIKQASDITDLEEVIFKNYELIKTTFVMHSAHCEFPGLSEIQFNQMAEEFMFVDANLSWNALYRLFIAASFEEQLDGNQGKKRTKALILLRFEFIELLVRVAQAKYLKTGKCKTIAEAFQMLIDINIKPVSNIYDWQGFRTNEVWTLDVNDILEANLDNLQKIYDEYSESQRDKLIEYDILVKMKTQLKFTEPEIKNIFSMSKMTVSDFIIEQKTLRTIKFVEFLEIVCRGADLKFQGSELESVPLAEKLKHYLDDLFHFHYLVRINCQDLTKENTSESDSEY